MKYERAQEWRRLFKRELGVSHGEALRMFLTLEAEGALIRRPSGVWGLTYALRPEVTEGEAARYVARRSGRSPRRGPARA